MAIPNLFAPGLAQYNQAIELARATRGPGGAYPIAGGYQGGSTPTPTPTPENPVENTPTGPSENELINDIFSPTMDYLNQAESQIKSQQPEINQEIEAQYGTSKQSLEGEKASGERNLAQSEQGAVTRKEDASSAARRLFQELSAGGRQRFGGATSAGEAYSELTGRELQRGLGQTETQFNQAMMQIDNHKQDLQMKFTNALADLENQKNTAMNEARRFFEDKLLEITRMRGEAESNKAAARLSALQDLKNKVYAINMQDYQYKQQLVANNQASQAIADQAKQQAFQSVTGGQQAYQGMLSSTNVNPQTSLAMGGARQSQQMIPTGSIRREDEQYLT